ncbi:MAG: hypothetical protein IPL01_10580 [Acidobacteria bacterium]|nr:hypothetical protein [Acidobacteriota bacterium]
MSCTGADADLLVRLPCFTAELPGNGINFSPEEIDPSGRTGLIGATGETGFTGCGCGCCAANGMTAINEKASPEPLPCSIEDAKLQVLS